MCCLASVCHCIAFLQELKEVCCLFALQALAPSFEFLPLLKTSRHQGDNIFGFRQSPQDSSINLFHHQATQGVIFNKVSWSNACDFLCLLICFNLPWNLKLEGLARGRDHGSSRHQLFIQQFKTVLCILEVLHNLSSHVMLAVPLADRVSHANTLNLKIAILS